jgi:biopolymer transport protein ExbB
MKSLLKLRHMQPGRGSRTACSWTVLMTAVLMTAVLMTTVTSSAKAQGAPLNMTGASTTVPPTTKTTGPGGEAPSGDLPSQVQAPGGGSVSPTPTSAPIAVERPNTITPAVAPPVTNEPLTQPNPETPAAARIPAIGSLPTELSPWSMFMNADIVVKVVMGGLAFASLVTWTVWLAKSMELIGAKRRAKNAARKLALADSLADAIRMIEDGWTRRGPVAELAHAAVRELERSDDLSAEGVKERSAIALSRIEARSGRSMVKGTGLLATIGATAPFVGLFGTVWGIMNSFIGISKSHTTNLAVVAPGIAEALLATAIGLVAAIPAVVIYNVFARSIAGYRATLSDASGEVLQHLSRDLERRERDATMDAVLHTGTPSVQSVNAICK